MNKTGFRNAINIAVLSAFTVTAKASDPRLANQTVKQVPAPPACLNDASSRHNVNPWVLRAIIWHESRNDETLIMRNRNGSVDVGLGGINSINFEELGKHGIEPGHLMDGCVGTFVAAWYLAKQMKVYGNSWASVGAYHSRNPADAMPYIRKIRGLLIEWRIVDEQQ